MKLPFNTKSKKSQYILAIIGIIVVYYFAAAAKKQSELERLTQVMIANDNWGNTFQDGTTPEEHAAWLLKNGASYKGKWWNLF